MYITDKIVNEHIKLLMKRHNCTNCEQVQGLTGYDEYLRIIKPAIDILKKRQETVTDKKDRDTENSKVKDIDIENSKVKYNNIENIGEKDEDIPYKTLLENSQIRKRISDFIKKTKATPGAVIGYGTMLHENILVFGNRAEVPEAIPMEEETIFDIASISKLFTAISIFQLANAGKLSFDDTITKHDSRFLHLGEVTVGQLLSFQVPLNTDERIDEASDVSRAKELLFGVKIAKSMENPLRPYTDMGAMVLKYVVESASGQEFGEYVKENIFDKCGMENTYYDVPETKRHLAVSNNFEKRIVKDRHIHFNQIPQGVANDPKVRIFQNEPQGHAGVFSVVKDMLRLSRGLIEGRVLPVSMCKKLSTNQTGKILPDGRTVQYLGYLCHSKSPIKEITEIYQPLSGTALAAAGYTGCELTIDFDNQFYYFLGTNRCHNRVTKVIPAHGKTLDDYLIRDDGIELYRFEDKAYVYSQNFSRIRAANLKDCVLDMLFSYRFIESCKGQSAEVF